MSWDELIFLPAWSHASQLAVRLLIAAILGGIIGYERELKGKAAGIRTHMLVSLGSAIIIATARLDGIPINEMSRVIKGVIVGIGFLGAGVILKRTEEQEIRGTTTAAGIWATAMIGVAVGLGQVWLAVISMLGVWIVLYVFNHVERFLLTTKQDKA